MSVRNSILVVILFLLVLTQVTLLPIFTSFVPNILLILVLALCWSGRRDEAAWAAFLGGTFCDLLSVRPLGVHSLLLIAVVAEAVLIRRYSDNFLSRFLAAFLAALGWCFYPHFGFSERVVLLAALDAVLSVVFYPLLALLFERSLRSESLQLSFKEKLR